MAKAKVSNKVCEYHLFIHDLKHDFNFELVVDDLNYLFEVSCKFPSNCYDFYDMSIYHGTFYEVEDEK